ncbi:recombinase family protein [Amaricoccus sp.]|uniref:recombinase family protein n=1 Tax=Amaricoccus sp. TaxID=1872485 RepID=UPI003FA600C4
MKIGYARVSTDEQNLDLQRHALEAAGCAVVYEDRGISGATADRPGLAAALARLEPGDVLVVWKLDRLGRSLFRLIEFLDGLGKAGGVSPRCPRPSTPPRQAVGWSSTCWAPSRSSSGR